MLAFTREDEQDTHFCKQAKSHQFSYVGDLCFCTASEARWYLIERSYLR